MGYLKVTFPLVLMVAVSTGAIYQDEYEPSKHLTNGYTFSLKSTDYRYGYLRRYGYYAPDKKDLLEFTSDRYRGSFRFLINGAIQEVSTGKCFNLVNSTNQQIVLNRNCYGRKVATWYYNSQRKWLKNRQTGKCLSPWNYEFHTPKPRIVKYVPGLDSCRDYNTLELTWQYEPPTEPVHGSYFSLKSTDYRYGYLRRYGYYAPDKKDLLEFTSDRYRGSFRFLNNGAIQEESTGKCFNFVTSTHQQIVLTSNCYGREVATWYYIRRRKWLYNRQTGKCLSPWNYEFHTPKPRIVKFVPGLDDCRDYNTMELTYRNNEPDHNV